MRGRNPSAIAVLVAAMAVLAFDRVVAQVFQPAGCTISPSQTLFAVPIVGGSATDAFVTGSVSCSWTAVSSANWIVITSGATGTGSSGSVSFNVFLNSTGARRSGTITIGSSTITILQSGGNLAALHDLDGDGISDLVIRNLTTGGLAGLKINNNLAVVPMNPFQSTAGASRSTVDVNWRLAGSGDLTGDGYADLVWQHTSGALAVWFMQGSTVGLTYPLLLNGTAASVGTSGWQIRAVGDVDGDGHDDLIWHNSLNGGLAVWLMNGPIVMNTLPITANGSPLNMTDPNWVIVGAGDLNGDGRADIVWQNTITGGLGAWTMNGNAVQVMHNLTPDNIPTDFRIGGVGDVNGDGFADLVWIKQSTGELYVWCMNGFTASVYQGPLFVPATNTTYALQFGWTLAGPG